MVKMRATERGRSLRLRASSGHGRKLILSIQFSASILATTCLAQQWPSHPLPTNSADAAAYGRAIKTRPSLDKCLKEAAGTTPGIRDCLSDEYTYQDERLNRAYKKLMLSQGKEEGAALRIEERRWIGFRDKFCALDPEPGQGQELDHEECLVDQTTDRATDLESRLPGK